MPVFRLEHFPNVCRVCLQHQSEDLLISMDKVVHFNDAAVSELIDPVSPELQHFTPTGVCKSCYKEFNGYLAYRNRLMLVRKFISGLAQVRLGQLNDLDALFTDHGTELLEILRELKITDKRQLIVQDLLDEFEEYSIASMTGPEERVEQSESDADSECTPNPTGSSNGNLKTELVLLGQPDSDPDGEQLVCEMNSSKEEHHNENVVAVDFAWEGHPKEEGDVDAEHDGESVVKPLTRRLRSTRQKGTLQQCQKCPFKTCYDKSFQLHMRKHQKEESTFHICKRCGLTFDSKRELDHHKRSTHRDHMCDTCGMAFDTKFVLETHRKRHGKVRQYKCEYCPLEYFTKAEKLLHIRQLHLKAFEVNCPECALPFRTKQTLTQHMKTHTNQRTHTCNVCGFSFKAHTHLNRHMKELHQGVQYQCEHCDMSYRRKDKLRLHVEKKHNIQTYFVCDICLQSYDTSDKLQEHKVHHQSPRDLQCGVCLGAYVTSNEFSDHLCITYRENYVCCNRDFKYHFFYNKHMFLAHGEQTNARVKPTHGMLLGQYRANRKQAERCPRCEQEFPTRLLKKQHMQTCGAVLYEGIQYVEQEEVEDLQLNDSASISFIEAPSEEM